MGFWGLCSVCIPPSPWSAGIPGACAGLCVDGQPAKHHSALQPSELLHVCKDSSHLVNLKGEAFPPSHQAAWGRVGGEKEIIWAQNSRFTVHCCRKIKAAGARSC